jgi:signal transduction histidine kinase
MKIRSRLMLQFAGIFAVILIFFSLVIYYFNSLYRADDFFNRIEGRARVVASYVLDKDEVDTETHRKQEIAYFHALPNEITQVYNAADKLIFTDSDSTLFLPDNLLNQVRKEGKAQYTFNDRQIVGVLVTDNQGEHVVLASSVDRYSLRKLQYLKTILLIGFLGAMVVVVVAGWAFAHQAMQPVAAIVSEVEKLSASDLHKRLPNSDGQDEVSHLARTFNHMLDRLETAFDMQRTFVANASHELRTPLTTMIGELEVALMKKREPAEYERVLQSTLEDARLLAELSNGLLQIAQASTDSSKIIHTLLRFDEVVWLAREQTLRRQPNASINIDFANFPEEEERLEIKGNEALLLIAIVNVLENAIKFSPEGRAISGLIRVGKSEVLLEISDEGLGIAEDDLKKVFIPFFRAGNVRNITGHGIGLPLTERILKLHNGAIVVDSQINVGTVVTISLPQAHVFIP